MVYGMDRVHRACNLFKDPYLLIFQHQGISYLTNRTTVIIDASSTKYPGGNSKNISMQVSSK